MENRLIFNIIVKLVLAFMFRMLGLVNGLLLMDWISKFEMLRVIFISKFSRVWGRWFCRMIMLFVLCRLFNKLFIIIGYLMDFVFKVRLVIRLMISIIVYSINLSIF